MFDEYITGINATYIGTFIIALWRIQNPIRKLRWDLFSQPVQLLLVWFWLAILFATLYAFADVFIGSKFSGVFNSDFYKHQGFEKTLNYVYFSFITLATIGYGDFHPDHTVSRVLVMVESSLGMCAAAAFVGSFINKISFHSSKFHIRSINFNLPKRNNFKSGNTVENIEIEIVLSGTEISIDNVAFEYWWINVAGSWVQKIGRKEYKLHHSRSIRVKLPFSEIYDDSIKEYSQGAYIQLSISAMSYTHTLWVKIDKDLLEEIASFDDQHNEKYTNNYYYMMWARTFEKSENLYSWPGDWTDIRK